MALWAVGLGVSVGYMMFQSKTMESRLEVATKQYNNSGAEPADPSGATMEEIRAADRQIEDIRDRYYDERLPLSDRNTLKDAEAAARAKVDAFNGAELQIQGVYLE
jgi:hypothetical protein